MPPHPQRPTPVLVAVACLGVVAAAAVTTGTTPASASTDTDTDHIRVEWHGQRTSLDRVVLFDHPTIVPGDEGVEARFTVENAGPSDAVLTAEIVDVTLGPPGAPTASTAALTAGDHESLYRDLTFSGGSGETFTARQLVGDETQIQVESIARGEKVDVPISYSLPWGSTAGNSALTGTPAEVQFKVRVTLTGAIDRPDPGTPTTPLQPATPPTPPPPARPPAQRPPTSTTTAAAPTPARPTIRKTGAEIRPWALGATVLMLAGLALVKRERRRR